MLASVETPLSKHELSAFFRNPSQRQYVACNNQILRNFFQGLEVREQRFAVERWVNAQPQCPTRKQAVAQFPDAPQRIVRAAVQSRMDRERR